MSSRQFEIFDLSEYQERATGRVKEQDLMDRDLSVRGLFMVMFDLKMLRPRNQAARCPGRVAGIEVNADGLLYTVTYSLLDNDLQPVKTPRHDTFWDGYLLSGSKNPGHDRAGYFLDYDGTPDGGAGLQLEAAAAGGLQTPLIRPPLEAMAA